MYPLLLLHKAGNLLSPVPCSLVHRFLTRAANYIYLQKGLDQEVFLPAMMPLCNAIQRISCLYCIHRAGAFFGVTYVYINFFTHRCSSFFFLNYKIWQSEKKVLYREKLLIQILPSSFAFCKHFPFIISFFRNLLYFTFNSFIMVWILRNLSIYSDSEP